MKRREFIAGSDSAVGWPLVARAQQQAGISRNCYELNIAVSSRNLAPWRAAPPPAMTAPGRARSLRTGKGTSYHY
jgi:hypothetical protein